MPQSAEPARCPELCRGVSAGFNAHLLSLQPSVTVACEHRLVPRTGEVAGGGKGEGGIQRLLPLLPSQPSKERIFPELRAGQDQSFALFQFFHMALPNWEK